MSPIGAGWGFAANTFLDDDGGGLDDLLTLGPAAEAAGFDSVWVGDHIIWHTPIVDALTLLSAFAATTTRVKLGTAILLLGIRQPVVGVKAVTSLNALSGNRLVLGVGTGGENPDEFEACGVPLNERGKRLDAALQLLEAQWTAGAETPRVQPIGTRIPVLIGGRSDAARRRVLRYGDGWLHSFVSARRIAEETQQLAERSERHITAALHVYVCTGDDATAGAEASRFLGRVYAMDPAPLKRYTVAGTPERCAEQLHGYLDAGVTDVVLRPAAWDQRRQLEDWAENLLPNLPRLPVSAANDGEAR